MKGKFEVVEDGITASVASIPGPSPELSDIGNIIDSNEEKISGVEEQQERHGGM
jgi:hypothetical protein